jgi:hypothetical protein
MISMLLSVAFAAAAAAPPAGGPPPAPRKAYAGCLTKVVKDKTSDKLTADAFTAAAKAACAAEEAAFVKSIVDYDMAAGTKRADAEEGAKLQIEDYLANAADTYATYTSPN